MPKLAYRPLPHDDWGMIRNADGTMHATVRRPLDEDEAAGHRAAGTDPFEPLARALIAGIAAEEEPDEATCCIVCGEAFMERDPVYLSEDGTMHALCCGPGREYFYNADEAPLVEGEPIPRPILWTADFKGGMPVVGDDQNDDICVSRFAMVMRAKLAAARMKGRGGWDDPEECTQADLSRSLREHVEKGDPVDVANLAMMLHQRGLRILPAAPDALGPPSDILAFAKACVETGDGEIQQLAFKFGLLAEYPFDPAIHQDPDGCAKAGDPWFALSWNFHYAAAELRVLAVLRPFLGRHLTRRMVDQLADALMAHATGREPAPPTPETEPQETTVEQAFSGWAIVELMGHRTRPGRVKEIEMAGSRMLQVDIPISDDDFVTEFYGAPALYSIRPCTEEIARTKAGYAYHDPRPIRPVDYRPEPMLQHQHDHADDGPDATSAAV